MPTSIYQPSAASLMDGGAVAQAIGIMTAAGDSVHLKLPIGFALADAAVLYTIPTGLKLQIVSAYWEITTSFTGGSSSAIGVSSDDTDYATKGDILGGSAGDVAAVVISTGRVYKGTVGTKFGSSQPVVVGGGKIIRYDKVTSTFTAGAGFVHLSGFLID